MDNRQEPASPVIDDCISTHNKEIFYGLTKREYFAGLAMQGMLTNKSYRLTPSLKIAQKAVLDADALLKALEE